MNRSLSLPGGRAEEEDEDSGRSLVKEQKLEKVTEENRGVERLCGVKNLYWY